MTRKSPAKFAAKTDSDPAIPANVTSDAVAVMFTFSFGSAFAATGTGTASDVTDSEIAEFKAAVATEAATLQKALETVGTTYMNSISFNKDGEATVGAVTVTKAVLQAQVDEAVYAAQRELDELAVILQSGITKDNLSKKESGSTPNKYDTIDKWKALLRQDLTANTFGTHAEKKGYTALANAITGGTATALTEIEVAKAQYTADLKDAQDKLNGYLANVDKYSDYTDDWYVTEDNANYEGTTKSVATLAGITSPTAGAKLSAKAFVKGVANTQLKAVNDAEATVKAETSPTATTYTDASTAIKAAAKIAKTVIEGQKIDAAAGITNYVPAVPTAEEIKADTTLDTVKARNIRQMKADLNSAAVKIETALRNALDTENKKAKPDTAKVNEYTAELAALDARVAACDEVYTALINYCDSKSEIDDLMDKAKTPGTVGKGIAALAISDINGYTAAKTELTKNVTITENVDALEAEAALLQIQKDVNGELLYNTDALKEALKEQTEKLYKEEVSLATAKNNLQKGDEVALVFAKRDHINYINGNPTTSFTPVDKNNKAITKQNLASKQAWNKATATRSATATTVNGTTVATAGKEVAVYDKEQKEALKTLVAETEKAIKEAKTVAEVKSIFAAAQEKYEAIDTTADHESAWAANGKLTSANNKAGYKAQIESYAEYLLSTVDTSKYYVQKNDLVEKGNKKLYTAYTTDELAAKFAEAKTAMEAALKTKDDVKAEKANVEKLIDAIGTVTIDSKDAIVAAADALDAYNKNPGKLSVSNEAKLNDAKTAYELLAAKALDDAFKALDDKTIAVADKEAVEALRAQYDAYAAFCKDYDVNQTAKTNDADASVTANYPNSVQKLEKELSDAKVAAVRELMIKLPANPRTAQKADVLAARAAYEALNLDEQAKIVGTYPWQNLIDAEEALGLAEVGDVQTLKLTAKSTAKKGSITVKWTAKGVAEVDGYQVWKSTKANKGFKKAFTTKKTSYKNTKSLKKGKTYYYKVRAYKVVDGKNVYSDWSNKAYRKAK